MQSSPIARLADYFLVIGRGAPIFDRPPTSFTTVAPTSASHIPPPPSLFALRFHPVILPDQRYPPVDLPDTPLTTTINLFAFPSFHSLLLLPLQSMGDAAHPLWLSRRPRSHSFVLTKVNGQKQYGTCLTFFERVNDREKDDMIAQIVTAYAALVIKKGGEAIDEPALSRELHVQLQSHVLFQPKCLCILSMWPFFSLFATFLKSLFRVSCLSLATTALALSNGDRPAPILSFPLPFERYILNFYRRDTRAAARAAAAAVYNAGLDCTLVLSACTQSTAAVRQRLPLPLPRPIHRQRHPRLVRPLPGTEDIARLLLLLAPHYRGRDAHFAALPFLLVVHLHALRAGAYARLPARARAVLQRTAHYVDGA